MRWVFAALILANLGLLMWASWFRGDGETIAARPVHHPELMVPLTTPGVTLKARRNEKTEAPLVAAKPRPRCVDIGPLPPEPASAASAWLTGEKVEYAPRVEERRVESSFWIHVGPFDDRKQAEQRLRELKKLGLRDVLVMNDTQGKPAVSLGLFNQADNAKNRFEEMTRKGIDAKQEIRYRNETHTWLELRLAEPADAALARLRQRDWGAGVEVRDASCPVATPPPNTPTPGASPEAPPAATLAE